MQRVVDEDVDRQDSGLLRSSETNADDRDNEEANKSRAAVKVFIVLFERVKGV